MEFFLKNKNKIVLQEIGFLVTVSNRHQIVYIRDQNLLSRSYETVTERHSMRRN